LATLLLHVDGAAGIAGDMALGALVDLGVPVESLREGLRGLPVSGWTLEVERVVKGGLAATRAHVHVHGEEEHPHHHEHHHAPHGHGRTWPQIARLIEASALPQRVRDQSLSAYRRICEAEAKLHGVALDDVHLHELGAVDALVDICGACLGLELLGAPQVSASPPDLGGGTVRTEHGLLPVPAPATLDILRGYATCTSGLPLELTTPTGAALLATWTGSFGPPPPMRLRALGYGAGTRDLADRPNVVRFTLGESVELQASGGDAATTLLVVEADVDDADPQLLAAFCERARELGARDATLLPLVMKKGRPGTRVTVLVAEPRRDAIVEALFRETTTIGCRLHRVERVECERETVPVATPWGSVRVKIARWAGRVVNRKPEHDDCLALARAASVPLKDVVAAALAATPPEAEPTK
jgi:uncharacterized protein (TIGR00299 family) protein